MKQVIVYPGRFQPMLPHHAAVFSGLQTQYPNADVYIATSDKVDFPKSPFNFAEKKAIMSEIHNIPPERILNVKRPYNGDDYAQYFDADSTQLILIVGEKDMQGDPRFDFNNVDPETGLDMKLNGSGPKWMQMINSIKDGDAVPLKSRGYLATAPTVERNGEVASASAFRNAFVHAVDTEHRREVMRNYLGKFDQGIFDLLQNKILDNKMSEDINRLKHLAGLDEAPVNFDDYQSISPKDAKAAAERPAKAAASDPSKVEFFPADPEMFHSTIKKSVANRMGPDEDPNDPVAKKEHFMMELLKAPALLLGEINARLKNDDNGLAVSDRLSAVIQKIDEVGSVMSLPEDDKKFVIQLVSNALKNMDLVKDPKADQERADYEKEFESVDLSDVREEYGINEIGRKIGRVMSYGEWKSELQREFPGNKPKHNDGTEYTEDEMRQRYNAYVKRSGKPYKLSDLFPNSVLSTKTESMSGMNELRKLAGLNELADEEPDMSEIKCPNCDQEHPVSAKACPHCGTPNHVAEGAVRDQAQDDFEILANMKHDGASEQDIEAKAQELMFGIDVLHAVMNDWESPFADPDAEDEPEMEEGMDPSMLQNYNPIEDLEDCPLCKDTPKTDGLPTGLNLRGDAVCKSCDGFGKVGVVDHIKGLSGMDKEHAIKWVMQNFDSLDLDPTMFESFDHDAEQSREEEAYNELMDAYGQGGEEAYAKACGLSLEELDQEIGEICRDKRLHPDDDRDECIQIHAEETVDNADWKDHGEYDFEPEDADMEEAIDGTVDKAIEEAMLELKKLAGVS